MRTLKQIQELHPTAEVIQVSEETSLYIINYPGLSLGISCNHMIAFHVAGHWHMATQKGSLLTKKNKVLFREQFKVTKWHDTNKELQQELINYIG